MDNLGLKLCDSGEELVKKYECTTLHKLFGKRTTGNLYVTDKRVIYYSSGKSLFGKSIISNEIPIDDVAGLNFYLGADLNIVGTLFFSLIAVIVGNFILSLLPYSLRSWSWGLIFCLPSIIHFLWQKNYISEEVKKKVLDQLNEVDEKVQKIMKSNIFLMAMKGLMALGSLILIFDLVQSGLLRYLVVSIILLFFLGRCEVFTFSLYSKTSQGTGLYLPGKLVAIKDTTALDTLRSSPSKDAETLIHELGALVMDMNLMGTLVIDKWKVDK